MFSAEIDRWILTTRLKSSVLPSFDTVLRPAFECLGPSKESLAEARERVGGPIEAPLTPELLECLGQRKRPNRRLCRVCSEEPKRPR